MAADAHDQRAGTLLNQWEYIMEIYGTINVLVKRLASIWIYYNALVQKGSRPNLEKNHPNISHVGNGIISQNHP